jgi:hypothetical protein
MPTLHVIFDPTDKEFRAIPSEMAIRLGIRQAKIAIPDLELEKSDVKEITGKVVELLFPALTDAPTIGDHREIDGVDHVWCGGGWMAVPYSDYVKWPVQAEAKC